MSDLPPLLWRGPKGKKDQEDLSFRVNADKKRSPVTPQKGYHHRMAHGISPPNCSVAQYRPASLLRAGAKQPGMGWLVASAGQARSSQEEHTLLQYNRTLYTATQGSNSPVPSPDK